MLTREHAIADYDRGRVLPDRLSRKHHAHYLGYARQMLALYANGAGQTRRDLHRAVRDILSHETECPLRRIEAFCKLLDDASHYDRDARGRSAALRRQVFRLAAPHHPLVARADRLFEKEESQVKAEIARQIGKSWEEVDAALFADVIEFHRLRSFEGYPDSESLLARYNVAQVQAALFDAVEMIVWATDDFKIILRYAKLARLMHTIRRLEDGRYELRFTGPASVLRETRRYGVAMARFLPALIACRGWRTTAVLESRAGWKNRLELAAEDGLRSHLPPPAEFDSTVEEEFAKKWGPEPRDGWTLIREGDVLHQAQHVFVPDFTLQHADGRRALLEIVAFWTPEYLQAKLDTIARFRDQKVLLAVAERVAKNRAGMPADVLWFKTRLKVKKVMEKLE